MHSKRTPKTRNQTHRVECCAESCIAFVKGAYLISETSFNQPTLCPNATWNSTGITIANSSTIGTDPYAIFVNRNNTVYAVNHLYGIIRIWLEGGNGLTDAIVTCQSCGIYLQYDSYQNQSYYTSAYTYVYSAFVSEVGGIYINNGAQSRIDVWRQNVSNPTSTLYIGYQCQSVFIDTNDSLYCSSQNYHKVIKRSLISIITQLTTVAGTGCAGCSAPMLNNPSGIFVATSFDLYVADSNNHRIQLFSSGQLNGATVAGSGAPSTIQLRYPTAVMLDADGYLFITDNNNHRIIGSGPYGFRCVIGCTNGYGSGSNQLYSPQNMAFDSYGNIFVADTNNYRVQKFLLSVNSCSK